MAATASIQRRAIVVGIQRKTITDVTGDSSYVTGGYAVTAAQLGLTSVEEAVAQITTTAAAGNAVEAVAIPQAAGGILLKLNAAAAEVANASNVSTLVARVTAFGR